jgi:hypothetical protein
MGCCRRLSGRSAPLEECGVHPGAWRVHPKRLGRWAVALPRDGTFHKVARLERPAGDDDTGLAGAARFAAGAPCSRVPDGAVLTRRAPCSRALAGRATGGSSVASVAHGSPKAFTEV